MTWRYEDRQGYESDKIAALTVPYLQGERILDIGCGMRRVWPSALGIDDGCDQKRGGPSPAGANLICDGRDLSLFSDSSIDHIFSSHLLEHFHKEEVPRVLREWSRVLKIGGNIVLYVPSANLYPKCGEYGANKDHQWDIYPGDIEHMFESGAVGGCWMQLEAEERGENQEYSLFLVFRKSTSQEPKYGLGHLHKRLWERNPNGKPRALVIRYGAIGDTIQSAGILKHLKAKGYHVTVNCTPKCQDILKHDPHIDEWWVQDTDFVPNEQLGPYWQDQAKRFDLVINHCESIEGPLLALPGRLNHMYPDEARRRLVGKINYHERLHDIADVPYDFSGARFYATEQERFNATRLRDKCGEPVIAWIINGSSWHKTYPRTQIAGHWLNKKGVHIIFMGGPGADQALEGALLTAMERDGADMSLVTPMTGKLSLRQSMSLVQVVNCVVGPETGLVNAVGFDPNVPKVVYLSHSSPDNLTKHWLNATVLTPPRSKCPCYPCHRLHYTWEHCNKVEETQAALCASSVSPESIFEAVMRALGSIKIEKAA